VSSKLLTELVELSRSLGRPERDLAVLGEGNTSVRLDDESFLVKASGTSLARANRESFVKMDLERTLALLELRNPTDDELSEALMAARNSDDGGLRPSIEAIMHALALTDGEATFVGHAHPTAVNSVLCSDHAEALSAGAIFPDQVVVLGRYPLLIPYADVGLPLARALHDSLREHKQRVGAPPKTIRWRPSTPASWRACSLLGSRSTSLPNRRIVWIHAPTKSTVAGCLGKTDKHSMATHRQAMRTGREAGERRQPIG